VPELIRPDEMDTRMDIGLDTFAINIPAGFQRDLLAGRRPQIQVNVDATRMSQAFVGAGHIRAIIDAEVRAFMLRYRELRQLPVELELRMRFNPQLEKSWFGSIMEVINKVTMLAIVLTGAALIREREHGTIEHLLVMPVTPFQIMASKVWAKALVVLVATVISLLVVVKGILAVPLQGSLLLFLCGTLLHLFAATSLGILLATLARSMPQFGLLIMLVLLPLQMLLGATTPRESMPDIVQQIMLVAPNTHFVSLAQAILYRGAGLAIVWPQFVMLGLIGIALFLLTLIRFRKTISAMA